MNLVKFSNQIDNFEIQKGEVKFALDLVQMIHVLNVVGNVASDLFGVLDFRFRGGM